MKSPRRWLVLASGLLAATLMTAFGMSGCTAFGEHAQGERLARMTQSPEWHDDHFENPQPLWNDIWGALRRSLDTVPGDVPDAPVAVLRSDGSQLQAPAPSGLRVTWFGHSSSLIEIDGSRVLTDPIWSERPSPVPFIGPVRFYEPPIALKQLPPIDVVVISHDHYDHLDRDTVIALKGSKAIFVVPLGIGADLAYWGIPEARITELDWWQSTQVGALQITLTPARHATGRIRPDADRKLWSGFALIGHTHRAYYSGDTGYLPALADVGQRLGPFDVALIESGQYDAAWPDWHMGPEQAVSAAQQVRAKVLIPVHWGLFKLAPHSWTEPVERVLAAAGCVGLPVLTPRPGESVEPTRPEAAARNTRWWPAATPWLTAQQRPIVATRQGAEDSRFDVFACNEAPKP